jgi:ABC-type amino acid transport system permease subunit
VPSASSLNSKSSFERTRTGAEVMSSLNFTHLMSMKQLVVPQSMRACVHHLTAVYVDSISTFTRRDIGPGLAVMTYLTGNQSSQAGRQLCWLGMGGWEGVCMTSVLLIMHIRGSVGVSTSKHAKPL